MCGSKASSGVLELLERVRRLLLERLARSEDRCARNLVAMIEFMRHQDMDPCEVLEAAVFLLIAIDAKFAEDALTTMQLRVGEVRRIEIEGVVESPAADGMH